MMLGGRGEGACERRQPRTEWPAKWGHTKGDGHPGCCPRVAVPFYVLSGGVLLSHEVPLAVPSAQSGLASGFGMEDRAFPRRYDRRNTMEISNPRATPTTPGPGIGCGFAGVGRSYPGNRTVDA